eukprot:scaffold27776_cov20-Tisochrysis_lutea.AAC.2
MDVIPVVASVLLNAFSCPCSLQHKHEALAKAAKEHKVSMQSTTRAFAGSITAAWLFPFAPGSMRRWPRLPLHQRNTRCPCKAPPELLLCRIHDSCLVVSFCSLQHEAQARAAKERKALEKHAKQEHLRFRRPKPLHEKVGWGVSVTGISCIWSLCGLPGPVIGNSCISSLCGLPGAVIGNSCI